MLGFVYSDVFRLLMRNTGMQVFIVSDESHARLWLWLWLWLWLLLFMIPKNS
ncbi:MAG: hypothetical protein OXC44_06515 [Proteobacteria bacterium]|nr:hypothetical protein [Pseudomonadota bacterium]